MIISLCNRKGGVGKTTIAINIAAHIAGGGSKVLYVDADPLGTVVKLKESSDFIDFDVLHYPEADLYKQVYKLARAYRHTIIDNPPGLGDITLSSLLTSNMAIVPVEPSSLSVGASTEISAAFLRARTHNKHLQPRMLVSRKVPRTAVGRAARDLLSPHGIELLDTEICQRTDYVKSLLHGKPVLRYRPRGKAAGEIRRLCEEIRYEAFDSRTLLQDLKDSIDNYYAVRTGRHRSHERRLRLIPVDFTAADKGYRGFITNVSPGGAFIETAESFPLGEAVTLSFQSPADSKPLKVAGKIVRTDVQGVGVQFAETLRA